MTLSYATGWRRLRTLALLLLGLAALAYSMTVVIVCTSYPENLAADICPTHPLDDLC